jgi:hypothetical protein
MDQSNSSHSDFSSHKEVFQNQKKQEASFDNSRSPAEMGNYGGAKANNQKSTFGRTNLHSFGSPTTYESSAFIKPNVEDRTFNKNHPFPEGDGVGDRSAYRDSEEQGIWNYIKEFFGIAFSTDRHADERVQENVKKALSKNMGVDAYGIEVSVSDGVVTLVGTVSDGPTKSMANDAAQKCGGVRAIRNELRALSLASKT